MCGGPHLHSLTAQHATQTEQVLKTVLSRRRVVTRSSENEMPQESPKLLYCTHWHSTSNYKLKMNIARARWDPILTVRDVRSSQGRTVQSSGPAVGDEANSLLEIMVMRRLGSNPYHARERRFVSFGNYFPMPVHIRSSTTNNIYDNIYDQYHGCWWHGSLRSHAINSHDIDLVLP